MHPDKYPVQWEGRTLYAGPWTADRKEAFCQWLKPRYVAEAHELAQAAKGDKRTEKVMAQNFQAARQEVNAGGLFWTAQMSGPVAAALLTRDGARQAARLLFDEEMGDWSDDDVDAFLEAKDPPRDEGNLTDYQVVMDLIWEAADPKAKRPSAPSAGPGATGGSSPGSPPATSDSPAPTPAA